jgi:hypothetical protein
MAKAWLSSLLSELHREALKTAGFRKEGNTFSRDRGAYTERFNFQGSSGSTSEETLFYLNVGVEFSAYESSYRDWIYMRNIHWACRVEELVPSSPERWSCRLDADRATLKLDLAEVIRRASEAIARRIDEFRAEYLDRVAGRAGGNPG